MCVLWQFRVKPFTENQFINVLLAVSSSVSSLFTCAICKSNSINFGNSIIHIKINKIEPYGTPIFILLSELNGCPHESFNINPCFLSKKYELNHNETFFQFHFSNSIYHLHSQMLQRSHNNVSRYPLISVSNENIRL